MQFGMACLKPITSMLLMFTFDQCGKSEGKAKFLTCAKCTQVLYCSKECQVTDWKRGGHKADCQGDLRTLNCFYIYIYD